MKAELPPGQQQSALRWLLLVLVTAGLLSLTPLWVSLVLGAWFAALTRPLLDRLTRVLGGRPRAAAALTLVFLLMLLLPVVLLGVSLGSAAVELVQRVASSQGGKSALVKLVSDHPSSGEPPSFSMSNVISLVEQYGTKAWGVLQVIAGKAATGLVGLFVFLLACYTFLLHGRRIALWLQARLPIAPQHTQRLTSAFFETGRGLVIGVGLTGLTQGAIATIAYFALSIPSALVLGLLTAVASVVPPVGTALVWVPVAVGLGLSGRWGAAAILAAIGILVISLVDNLLRPIFSHMGQLKLPTFLLLLSIFGGLSLYGASGLILGPLLVRLAIEALEIARDQGLSAAPEPEGTTPQPSDDIVEV